VSPEERLRRLAAEVRLELQRVQGVVRDLDAAIRSLAPDCPASARMAVAGYLHSYFTGCESILAQIARVIGDLPRGESWHQALLVSATAPIAGVRPPVLSAETADRLLNLLRFRHFFRASYGVELDVSKLSKLGAAVPTTDAAFRADIEKFLGALESSD